MFILELYEPGQDTPYGTIALDKNNQPVTTGLDTEYFDEWLSGAMENDAGDIVEAKDGVKFLEAVKYKLLKNVYDDELIIKGPIER